MSHEHNIQMLISYDGTDYFGWQATKTGPSIEGVLKAVIEQIIDHDVILQAASRTDRGVHAHGQVVNFFSKKIPRINSLNALLPKAIRVHQLTIHPLQFHPTLDAVGKEYIFQIDIVPVQDPFRRHYAWHVPGPFDLICAQEGAKKLVGRHDFSAFCNRNEGRVYIDTYRELWWCDLIQEPWGVRFAIAGNQFLYKMARNIVGTLVGIGKGLMPPDAIDTILIEKKRAYAGVCAPAHGLTLNEVFYNLPTRYNGTHESKK